MWPIFAVAHQVAPNPCFLIALRLIGQRRQIGCSVPRCRACSVGGWEPRPRPAANRVAPDQQPILWPGAWVACSLITTGWCSEESGYCCQLGGKVTARLDPELHDRQKDACRRLSALCLHWQRREITHQHGNASFLLFPNSYSQLFPHTAYGVSLFIISDVS